MIALSVLRRIVEGRQHFIGLYETVRQKRIHGLVGDSRVLRRIIVRREFIGAEGVVALAIGVIGHLGSGIVSQRLINNLVARRRGHRHSVVADNEVARLFNRVGIPRSKKQKNRQRHRNDLAERCQLTGAPGYYRRSDSTTMFRLGRSRGYQSILSRERFLSREALHRGTPPPSAFFAPRSICLNI